MKLSDSQAKTLDHYTKLPLSIKKVKNLQFTKSVAYLGRKNSTESGMCVCVPCHFSRVQLFVTSWTVAHQVPLSLGFSRQEYWHGLPCPPLGDLPDAEREPASLLSLTLAGKFFTTSATWEALKVESVQFSCSVISDSATPWIAAHQASLSITNSQSLPKLMSIESMMPSNPLSSLSPAFHLSQNQGLFRWVSSSLQVAKVLEFQLQHHSFQWTFRTDFL